MEIEHHKQSYTVKALVFSMLLLAVFIVVYASYIIVDSNKRERIEILENVSTTIVGRLNGNLDYLSMLADMRIRGEITPENFELRTKSYLKDHQELINFTWVDNQGYIQGVSPLANNQQIIGLHLDLPEPARASKLAKESHQAQYTKAFEAIQGGCSFEVWSPVYDQDKYLGLFAAVYSCQKLLDNVVIGSTLNHFQISLTNITRSFKAETYHPDMPNVGGVEVKKLNTNNGLILGVAKYRSFYGDINSTVLIIAVFLLISISVASVSKIRKEMKRRQLLQENLQRTNESLNESNQRFSLLFESSPVGMILIDDESTIKDANQYICDLFNYEIEILINEKIETLVHGDHLEKYQKIRSQYEQSLTLSNVYNLLLSIDGMASSGETIPLEIALAPLVLDGKIHTVVTVFDDSKRKQYINNLNDKNNELNQSNRKLIQSNEQLERFAYVCSHDLQEPVRMVQSFAQLLQEGIGTELDEKNCRYLNFMIDGSNRARDMIDDMLQYCRLDQPISNYKKVDLRETLIQVHEAILPSIESNDGKLTWQENLPTIDAVPSQLFQLILNLVSNGLKFNRSKVPAVKVTATRDESFWYIAVKDNGIGIATEYQQQIFNIFSRLHGNREFPGTGIGLASCKLIVERHHASISVQSVLGKGSTFIIKWPVVLMIDDKSTLVP